MKIFALFMLGITSVIFLLVFIYLLVEKYSIGPILSCALFFCAFVLVWVYSFVSYRGNIKPETIYEQKAQAAQKAERELQKFLIDHPEFKEIKE